MAAVVAPTEREIDREISVAIAIPRRTAPIANQKLSVFRRLRINQFISMMTITPHF
jgi:hypothetical protein